ncbi:MAG: glycosyltransferase family 2 protein [Candidatus Pelagibacter sp.]
MFLTIITPTNNSEDKILKCINSVNEQTFKDYEHIIVDNKSTDETLNIIKHFNNEKIKIISEKDNGIYFAMNKGIEISKGKYLLFLNSDDYILEKNFFDKINNIFKNDEFDLCYTNIIYQKNIFNISRKYKSGNQNNINKIGWHIPHPGTVIKKKYINSLGNYNTKYLISADFDFFIKCQNNKKTTFYYLDEYSIKMSTGGASSGIINIIKANYECYNSLLSNGYKNPLIFVFVKLIKKFFQLF